jgi:hypothetical protein
MSRMLSGRRAVVIVCGLLQGLVAEMFTNADVSYCIRKTLLDTPVRKISADTTAFVKISLDTPAFVNISVNKRYHIFYSPPLFHTAGSEESLWVQRDS